MAKKQLNTYVHVVERDSDGNLTGRSGTFGPDDDLSKSENAWVAKAVTNPDVWAGGGQDDEGVPADGSANTDSGTADLAEAAAEATWTGGQDGPPPKGGAGSGAPAWREYAARNDVEVPADASREDVIAALEGAGVRTE